jgi:hypothetical protein
MPRDLIASEVRDFSEEQEDVSAQPVWNINADSEKYLALSREMIMLKEQKDVLAKREATIKAELMDVLFRLGQPYGPNGQHRTIDFPEPIRGIARFVRQAKSTVTTDVVKAEAIARSRGIYTRIFPSTPTFSESAVMVALEQGKLTEVDVDEIFVRKTTYAFVPEKVK